MTFTDELHELARPLWLKSFQHPFITELAAGKLPLTKFKFYLKQDNYYLTEFAQLHAKIASQLSNPIDQQILLAGATTENNDEALIRTQMLSNLDITSEQLKQATPTPAAYNYVTHMYYELTMGSPARATAALLPCYWLYSELGTKLTKQGSPVPIYQQFIDGYADTIFTDSTDQMIALVERLAQQSGQSEQTAMKDAFLKSSTFEFQFWQMAYQQKQWSFR